MDQRNSRQLTGWVASVLVFLLLPTLPAFADDEYSVAFWGQTHIKEAVHLHQTLTPSDFSIACHQGIRSIHIQSPSRIISSETYSAWKDFSDPRRLKYCRKFPHKVWYLLGEAPYFMLPSKPGDHK